MNFTLVTQTQELEHICAQMATSKVLLLDTEFVRTRTYYPRLGLIQVYDGKTLALVDPIAIKDLSALWALLGSPSILKVLHACSEDLEVFQHAAGFMPTPMIDTQIMVAFLGQGLSVGFASLIEQYLGISISKAEARTDWCARPLSDNQLNYAAADVYYLLPLFEKLKQEIEAQGWLDAVMQECEQLALRRGKKPDPEQAYLEINNAWQLSSMQLGALKLLAKWRMQKAQEKDLALNFVVKDLDLWKMARYNIRSLKKMQSEDFNRFEIERYGNTMLRIMAQADEIPVDKLPKKIERLIDKPGYKQGMSLLKGQIKEIADSLKLAPEFVGSKKQMHQLLNWYWQGASEDKLPELISGWRAKHLSARILPLLQELKR